MNTNRKLEDDIQQAAYEIMDDCPHALPPVNELLRKLSDADNHRNNLMQMVHASNRYMNNFITPLQQTLIEEFAAMQAAKIDMSASDMLDEVCHRYVIGDVQLLKIRDFWEAMNFISTYARESL